MREVKGALRTKAVPLVAVNVVQLIVFGPDAIGVVFNAVRLIFAAPHGMTTSYDSVQAAFVTVYVLSFLLAIVAFTAAWQLWQKLKNLERP